jgi:hypothetical protein
MHLYVPNLKSVCVHAAPNGAPQTYFNPLHPLPHELSVLQEDVPRGFNSTMYKLPFVLDDELVNLVKFGVGRATEATTAAEPSGPTTPAVAGAVVGVLPKPFHACPIASCRAFWCQVFSEIGENKCKS